MDAPEDTEFLYVPQNRVTVAMATHLLSVFLLRQTVDDLHTSQKTSDRVVAGERNVSICNKGQRQRKVCMYTIR